LSLMSDTRDNDERSWKKKIEDSSAWKPDEEVNLQDVAKWWYSFSSSRKIPTESQIQEVLDWFIDRKEFLLTPFSAKKIEWKKLYEYARAWNPILKSSSMSVINAKLIEYSFPLVTVQFEVWSWTYIRSLGFELWKALGRWGILTELRRERVGWFSL
jgi:tRNA U55 pseudouridine synthase TruB